MPNNFIAEVISNSDPLKQGRVQIYIPHLMEGFLKDHYPWAFPDREFSSFIPEVGDKVWVFFEEEEYLKKPFYQNKVQFIDSNDANETIGSITGSYPDIKYIKLKNGVSIALNSNQTEATLKVGDAEIYINPSGEIHIKGKTGSLEYSVLGATLKQMLSDILDKIILHKHPTAPTGPASVPDNTADFTIIKTITLPTILSTSVKNS